MKTDRLKQGVLTENSGGIGNVTQKMVQARGGNWRPPPVTAGQMLLAARAAQEVDLL